MPHMFREGATYRVKRHHLQDGQALRPGELLRLNAISEICEDRYYRYRMVFLNIDGKGKDFIWEKTMPPDEETGIDLLEPLDTTPGSV